MLLLTRMAIFLMSAGVFAYPAMQVQASTHHWEEGNVVIRELGGKSFRFRCIDENYSDEMENHRPSALFLCDEVIPADFGSKYVFELTKEGTYEYVFYPGEIVNFGGNNDYKYSKIRSWLNAQSDGFADEIPVLTGVSRAYTGSTRMSMYGQLDGRGLSGNYIGSQIMTDRMFVLSVDEALKYRQWLWRFGGAKKENPNSQYGAFCKGYWLRTPVGTKERHDTDMVYVADLLSGSIHPAAVLPEKWTDSSDVELKVTSTFGVRPAFAVEQRE